MRSVDIGRIQGQLLGWYKEQSQSLPWRASYGEHQDPYKVLVSEFMLQQTRRNTVKGRFLTFVDRFPDLQALAAAHIEDVMTLWSGLGYYRRAHYLHGASREIVEKFGGIFPEARDSLQGLLGVGDYTSAAIRSFAFRKDDRVVDGNIKRVMVRFGALDEQDIKKQEQGIKSLIDALHPRGWGSEWYQGIMDLGAGICGVQRIHCVECPLVSHCKGKFREQPIQVQKRKVRVSRYYMYVFLVQNEEGHYLMERSMDRDLFKGLWTFPYRFEDDEVLDVGAYGEGAWMVRGDFVHELTHLRLRVKMVFLIRDRRVLENNKSTGSERTWIDCDSERGFPRWVGKVLAHVLQHQTLRQKGMQNK